ncbi:hypothetical protein P170DRAFT_65767 [Aspergillus steynii IBT 23096]|uniref:Uncharacterized protein n=1 Tax=Aspergillus steynii IBT 23096 TaxID=1392250 RepID=A0A2I2FTM1_9EURO|nr:uncharacterized protein P170DRAFT_65767 [Aspergillus steynii IBT 23096]PLB43927.1 hypothetical protein P170DRAFT_65767 [Aspergillus steynii IBT 23096]
MTSRMTPLHRPSRSFPFGLSRATGARRSAQRWADRRKPRLSLFWPRPSRPFSFLLLFCSSALLFGHHPSPLLFHPIYFSFYTPL